MVHQGTPVVFEYFQGVYKESITWINIILTGQSQFFFHFQVKLWNHGYKTIMYQKQQLNTNPKRILA